jgi:hypothetical protein
VAINHPLYTYSECSRWWTVAGDIHHYRQAFLGAIEAIAHFSDWRAAVSWLLIATTAAITAFLSHKASRRG